MPLHAGADAGLTLAPTLDLGAPGSADPARTGSKAASLAAAGEAGLRVIPGFAVTTAAHARFLAAGGRIPPDVAEALREPWQRLTEGGRSLVVRSSSTVEDIGSSSMAGRFKSVLDVRGWQAFLDAVTAVWASAERVGGADGPSPMGVLVQTHLNADRGGVLFGVDPVTGDGDHIVVEAVAGGPEALVSGRVTAQHYVITRRGRLLSLDHQPHHAWRRRQAQDGAGRPLLDGGDLRRLAQLAGKAAAGFAGPQDIEWALDRAGTLYLLQSRPVTATGESAAATGPVLGPGPLAETFPHPLRPLEITLWIDPLRAGVIRAIGETRAVAPSRLAESPVVTTVRGRVAADLELFGYVPGRKLSVLDPRPAFRHLRAAWHVGWLRSTLPARSATLVADVDRGLSAVTLDGLSDAEVAGAIDEATGLLQRLHHLEVLAGTVLPRATRTATGVALARLAHARAAGYDDAQIVHRHPVVLSLVPPSIDRPDGLPVVPSEARFPLTPRSGGPGNVRDLPPREALRLRVRWVQEFTAAAAWELGRRLCADGLLPDPASVTTLTLDELRTAATTGVLAAHPAAEAPEESSPPLPAQFRLTPGGEAVPAARRGARPGAGVGAGGGRGAGRVVHAHGPKPPAPGDVLVVRDLEPGLAAYLPGLAGLVAETGGTLSHLAILAREYGVPTVVALHDALHDFPAGAQVVVDGSTGEVTLAEDDDGANGGNGGRARAWTGEAAGDAPGVAERANEEAS